MRACAIVPITAAVAVVIAAMTLAAPPAAAQTEPKLESDAEQVSYALGFAYFRQLQAGGLIPDRFSPEAFALAQQDVVSGAAQRMTDQEISAAMADLRAWIAERQARNAEAQSRAAKAAGDAFLAMNAEAAGVTVLPSGLQYRIDRQGDGPKPKPRDTVETHYAGRHLNGEEFDSSYKRGAPTVFPVNGVIAGWTEALQLMPVGSKWELWIPYNLAYGASGTRGIPPYSTLHFTVELLRIVE